MLSLSPEFASRLRRLDYRSLAAMSGSAANDTERYLGIRAHLLIGEFATVDLLVDAWSPQFSNQGFLVPFLRQQVALFRRQALPGLVAEMHQLRPVPSCAYLSAEYHLVLGELHGQLGEFRQANRHHLLARGGYLAAGLAGCAAVAISQLAASADRLGARPLIEASALELKALAHLDDVPAVAVLSLQLESFRELEKENLAMVAHHLRRMLVMARSEARQRETGTATWLLAYAYLKTGRAEAARVLAFGAGTVDADHAAILGELGALAALEYADVVETRRRVKHWAELGLAGLPVALLSDLLVDKLLHSQDYQAAAWLAQHAQRELGEPAPALSMVDFRFSEASAEAKLGNPVRARQLLSAYRAAAAAKNLRARIEKADRLNAELCVPRPRPCGDPKQR